MQQGEGVTVLEHAPREDAVQIEGDDEGEVRSNEAPHLLQQESLRVEVAGGSHGAVQDEVESVGVIAVLLHGVEELRGEALEVRLRQEAGGAGVGAPQGHCLDVGTRLEDLEGAAHVGLDAAVKGEQLLPTADAEVLVPGLHRIEGGDLLHAFGDEDPVHGLQCP